MSLTAYAYFLEHEGRLEESLEILTLAARAQGSKTPASGLRRLCPVRRPAQPSARAVGRGQHLLRRRGRGCGRREIRSRAFAADWAGARFTVARATIPRPAPLRRVSCGGDRTRALRAQALAYADLGTVYSFQGLQAGGARGSLSGVPPHPRFACSGCDAGRPGHRSLARSERRRRRACLPDRDRAPTPASWSGQRSAGAHGPRVAGGNRVAFERCRKPCGKTDAVGQNFGRCRPAWRRTYHYKLGTGLARFETVGRAREALTAGSRACRGQRLNAWYFKIEQALESSRCGSSKRARSADEPWPQRGAV